MSSSAIEAVWFQPYLDRIWKEQSARYSENPELKWSRQTVSVSQCLEDMAPVQTQLLQRDPQVLYLAPNRFIQQFPVIHLLRQQGREMCARLDSVLLPNLGHTKPLLDMICQYAQPTLEPRTEALIWDEITSAFLIAQSAQDQQHCFPSGVLRWLDQWYSTGDFIWAGQELPIVLASETDDILERWADHLLRIAHFWSYQTFPLTKNMNMTEESHVDMCKKMVQIIKSPQAQIAVALPMLCSTYRKEALEFLCDVSKLTDFISLHQAKIKEMVQDPVAAFTSIILNSLNKTPAI